jgi:hypothetical protein
MDELYTMDRPRQLPVMPKFSSAAPKGVERLLQSEWLIRSPSRCDAIRTTPPAGCAIHAATSECYLRPIE